jgi:diamine N-acetyltransferase
MAIHVRPATAADAAALSALAEATFRHTFEAENTPEDMDRYVAETFSVAAQAAEIADPNGSVLLAEHRSDDGNGSEQLAGYAYVVTGEAPGAVEGPAPLELKRFYVDQGWHGHGVAHGLMAAVLDEARARGAETLWLGVWERNARAVSFYAKHGFTRVGEHTFVLGDDAQTDWLLARPVGSDPTHPG